MQRVQQNHGIYATGNGDEDFLSTHEPSVKPDFIFEALLEFTHPAILLFFGTGGKRLAERTASPPFIVPAGGDKTATADSWPWCH